MPLYRFTYTERVQRRFRVEAACEEDARARFWLDTSSDDEIVDVLDTEIDYIDEYD